MSVLQNHGEAVTELQKALDTISRLTEELAQEQETIQQYQEDATHDERVNKELLEENARLRKALDNLVTKTENVRAWLQNWDLPFADDDEWCETAKELRDALVLANRATQAPSDAE